MRQMTAMEADAAAYKAMQEEQKRLEAQCASLTERLVAKDQELKATIEKTESEKNAMAADFERQMEIARSKAELQLEKAVIAKERELQDKIRDTDMAYARLSVQADQMSETISRLEQKINTTNNKEKPDTISN